MTKETVIVGLSKDTESRPVAVLVQIASQYSARVYLECTNRRVNAKSIMGMMTLDLSRGEQLVIEADGEDEAAAVEALAEYLRSGQKKG